MLRKIFLVSLIIYSISCLAEIEDTENQRTLFTSKAPCKLSFPKSLGMNIQQERTSGISEGKLVLYKFRDPRARYMRVVLNTTDRSCSDSKSCLDDFLKSDLFEGITQTEIKKYDKGNFSVAEFIAEFEQNGSVRRGRHIAAYDYKENCQATVLLELYSDQKSPPREPLLEILDVIRVE